MPPDGSVLLLPKIRVPLPAECRQQYLESHQKSPSNPLRIRSLGIAIIYTDYKIHRFQTLILNGSFGHSKMDLTNSSKLF